MNLIIVILAIVFLYFLQLRLYNTMWDDKLSIQISFAEKPVTEGETAIITETIANQKRLPLPLVHVMFEMSRNSKQIDYNGAFQTEEVINNEIFSLKPYHKITRQLEINCPRRGYYRIRNLNVISSNLFLSGKYKKEVPLETSLFVYPTHTNHLEIYPIFENILSQYITIKQSLEDPFLLRGIRSYQPMDPMKYINWKASARTNELQVNLFEYTSNLEVILLLDLIERSECIDTTDTATSKKQEDSIQHKNAKLKWSPVPNSKKENQHPNKEDVDEIAEESIRILNTFADLFLAQGIPTGFITNAVNCRTFEEISIPPASGNTQATTIKQGLSSLLVLRNIKDFSDIINEEVDTSKNKHVIYILISRNMATPLQQSYNELCALHPGSILIALNEENTDFSIHCPDATIFSMEVNDHERK